VTSHNAVHEFIACGILTVVPLVSQLDYYYIDLTATIPVKLLWIFLQEEVIEVAVVTAGTIKLVQMLFAPSSRQITTTSISTLNF